MIEVHGVPLRSSEVLWRDIAAGGPGEAGTLGNLLREVTQRAPGLALLTDAGTGQQWTATELLTEASALAGGLLARHRPGARIATCLVNGSDAVLLQYAIALAGMTLVPINPRSTRPELDHALQLSGAAELFTGDDPTARLPRTEVALPEVATDALAQVQFTSGTTGRPKGVMITHAGMIGTAHAFAAALGPRAGTVWLNPMPLFHTAGNVLGTVAALAAGAEHVVLPFDSRAVLAAIGRHRATLISAAPTLLDLLLADDRFPHADVSTLGVVFTGGMTVTPQFADRVETGFGARLAVTFGMTETCGSALLSRPDDEDDVRRHGLGAPLPGTDACVVDAAGHVAPVGRPGELWLRGRRLTRGYLDDPAATAAAIDAAGWLHTGDRAEMDERGRCRIVGRMKDMIKTGGENVSPVEVEEVLTAHPAVEAAAVVGTDDPRWGEVVVAFVVAREAVPIDELTAWCRERLTGFKVPRAWHLVDALPMTASAKIRRAELRDRAARLRDQPASSADPSR